MSSRLLRALVLPALAFALLGGRTEAGIRKPTVTPNGPCRIVTQPGFPPGRGHELGQPGSTCNGFLAFGARSRAVRTAMQRMYGADSAYHTFSALVVDHAPQQTPGSALVDIRQPNGVRVAIYANDTGTGTPAEYREGRGSSLILYRPATDTFTEVDRPLTSSQPVPLGALPPGVPEPDTGATSFSSGVLPTPAAGLADILVHPAALITGPIFQTKRVKLAGTARYEGRTAWVLVGRRAPGAPSGGTLETAWRMWVDTQTGIVLRLVYLDGSREIGWAAMRDVRVNGVGPKQSQALTALERWTLPTSATYQDRTSYVQQTSTRSGPLSWVSDHKDNLGLLALLVLLVLVRLWVGRAGRRRTHALSL